MTWRLLGRAALVGLLCGCVSSAILGFLIITLWAADLSMAGGMSVAATFAVPFALQGAVDGAVLFPISQVIVSALRIPPQRWPLVQAILRGLYYVALVMIFVFWMQDGPRASSIGIHIPAIAIGIGAISGAVFGRLMRDYVLRQGAAGEARAQP